jgi:glycine dehydrogenase subunit 1
MRYLPHTQEDVTEMLKAIGARSVDDLFVGIPRDLRLDRPLDLPPAMPEPVLVKHMEGLAKGDAPLSFLGAGAYRHYVPAAVSQQLLRAEWYTSYTPYQPEISQGTLQAVFEYQTMVAELCGLDVANASLYDAATGVCEAVLMAARILPKRPGVVLARTVHPEYRETLATYLKSTEMAVTVVESDPTGGVDLAALAAAVDDKTAVVVVQQPNFLGVLEDVAAVAKLAHDKGALCVVACPEPVALGVLEGPGKQGADIVTGEGLGLTGSLSLGGPGFGFFATTDKHVRQMPGRIVGETTDHDGQRGYVLTLSTREQHIRREKATSNICTNHGLMALAGAMTLSFYGPGGLRELAVQNMAKARYFFGKLEEAGLRRLTTGPFFHESAFTIPGGVKMLSRLEAQGVVLGVPLARFGEKAWPEEAVLVCVTDVQTREALDCAASTVKDVLK